MYTQYISKYVIYNGSVSENEIEEKIAAFATVQKHNILSNEDITYVITTIHLVVFEEGGYYCKNARLI